MGDREVFIQAIENFSEKQDPLSEELDQFITYIARTGDILAPWEKVQKVFMNKLQLVLDEFYTMVPYKEGKVNSNSINDDFDEMKKRLLQLTEEFESPPFTIQRLCELLSNPRKNYTKCDKFMRGIEKNLMVVSSWSNLPRRLIENNEAMVNGVDAGASNGYVPVSDNRLKPHWANLPPSPISTTPPKIPGAPDFTAVTFPKIESPQDVPKETKDEASTSEPMVSEPVETSQTDKNENTSETDDVDSKPDTTSAIISSSPTKTINIKRKIDESQGEPPETDEKSPSMTEIAESPTKKLKTEFSEEAEKKHEEGKGEKNELTKPEDSESAKSTGDSGKTDAAMKVAEHPHDVSQSSENADVESSTDSANENNRETPSVENNKTEGDSKDKSECTDGHLGSSVDPPIEKMEVD